MLNVNHRFDLSITENWPIDCGIQVNPETNLKVWYCVSNEVYCNTLLDVPPNTVMQNSSRPGILNPVSSTLSYTDSTCGPTVLLSTYYQNDNYGGLQSDLQFYNQILELESTYVQFAVASNTPIWYNSGKSNTLYTFQWNITSTISGLYSLNPCVGCTNPIMEVFIYPLNIYYAPPYPIVAVNVSMSVTNNSVPVISYGVNFTVSSAQTGVSVTAGIQYMTYPFQGVGYRFYGVGVGSSVTLYNPTITDNTTRAECTSRVPPIWYEPLLRIESTAPYHECIITTADQLLNPTLNIGQCACDRCCGGPTCDCIAVTGYVCGGWGDCGASVLAPDGSTQVTGSGDVCGCYYWGLVESTGLYTYSDCKTIPIGEAIRTLLVPDSIVSYPSIYITVLPAAGVPIFEFFSNAVLYNASQVAIQCLTEGMFLPYYYTGDELNQLVLTTESVSFPVFMSLNMSDVSLGEYVGIWNTTWPWISPIQGSFFIYQLVATPVSLEGTCGTSPSTTCTIGNINNYAYSGTITGTTSNSFLIDGNTLVTSTTYAGTLTWSVTSSVEVTIWVFGSTNTGFFTSCTGGYLPTPVVSGGGNLIYTGCRCPSRIITLAGGITAAEIQVFNYNDGMRSTVYQYS